MTLDDTMLARLNAVECELLPLCAQCRDWDLHALAIRERVEHRHSAATGSGKTTFGRALVNFIPDDERLLTIEDVREMFLPNHSSRVHLLHSEGGQGMAEITGKTLLQACLRTKPDRVPLAELRSKVAYDYIVNISSGHPGSITTVHPDVGRLHLPGRRPRRLESMHRRLVLRRDDDGRARAGRAEHGANAAQARCGHPPQRPGRQLGFKAMGLRPSMGTWIENWYNPRRRHSAHGCISPSTSKGCTPASHGHHLRIKSSTVRESGATSTAVGRNTEMAAAKLNV